MNIRKMQTAAGGPIHYSRTMTTDNLSKAANYVGEYALKGLGTLGKVFTAPLTGGPLGPTTVVLPKTKKLLDAERKLRETQEELIGKAMTWISPLNYGAALATGNGLNAKKGEEEVASWSPAWQAVGRLGELYVGPKAVKGVKSAPRVVVNTAAKAGVKPAKAAVVAREIKLGIKLNAKNGRIEVTEDYFNSPDKWYRITETPEKYGIMELGKNVTTHDAPLTLGTINGWRSSILNAKVTKGTEGFIKKPPRIELNVRRKNGQAHGNTSQAAKGKLWGGTTSGSRLFPEGIIEGQAPSMINYGIDRTNFVITPWELVPNGGRVGFHTGEMPMSNLGWFLKTKNGTYTYEPIISEKRISYLPKLLLEPSTSLAFFERKPSKLSLAERVGVPKGERNNINNSGNLEKTVNNIILENRHWLPKETGRFAQKHSLIGSSYRKQYEKLWGKENTDRLTDDLLGKLVLIRNHLIETNIPLKGDFVYVVDGQAQAYRNGQEIGYLSNSYIDNGRALHPEMVKKQGINNAGVSELLYNGTILAENRPIISGSKLLMPEVTTHVWNKYPTRKLISMEGVHAWPLRTAQERGIKLNYEKNWHTLPEFSKLHQLAINENIRTNLTGLPIYKLSEPSYLPMVKNARIFDISLLRDGYINLDFTPGFAYKQGGKMNILEFLKNGSGIHIKEKNKGKFTKSAKAAGLTVQEHAKSVLNDPNATPLLKKRANFARNAAKWKHKEGGIIKAADGTKTNFFQKAGNWINNNKDLVSSVANAGLGIINNIKLNKAIDAQIEANEKLMEVNKQQAFMDNYKEALGMLSDRSDVVNRNRAWLIANGYNYSDDELLNKNLLLQQSKVGILDSLGGLSTDILNAFSNNKNSSPNDSYFGNYVKTLFKNPGTFNSDGSFNTSLGTYKWADGKLKNISNTYGTFNADGSMNLGNGLGTFSIKDGYKSRKFGILNS